MKKGDPAVEQTSSIASCIGKARFLPRGCRRHSGLPLTEFPFLPLIFLRALKNNKRDQKEGEREKTLIFLLPLKYTYIYFAILISILYNKLNITGNADTRVLGLFPFHPQSPR